MGTPQPPATDSTDATRLRFLRWFNRIGCAAFAALPIIAAVLGWVSATRASERLLEAEIARLERDGILVPIEDLAPQVPEGEQNAADVYRRAFAAQQGTTHDIWESFSNLPEGLRALRAFVEQNTHYYELLDEASDLPHCAFISDWSGHTWDLDEGHHTQLREAARMCDVRAAVLTTEGDVEGALGSCAVTLKLAERVAAEPTSIAQLVAYAIHDMAIGSFKRVLSTGMPHPETCQPLLRQVKAVDYLSASGRAAQGEQALNGIPTFEELRTGQLSAAQFAEWYQPQSVEEDILIRCYQSAARPLLNLDEVNYVRRMEQFIMGVGTLWYEPGDYYERAERVLDTAPWYESVVTRYLTDYPPAHPVIRDRHIAELRALQTVLVLKIHHTQHGDYPESLDGLSLADWEAPTDPFDGQPVRYRREGQGFIVWSVGPDMNDGLATVDFYDVSYADRRSGDYVYDIVFRCER